MGGSLIEISGELTAPAADCGHSQVTIERLPAGHRPWMQTVCIQGRSLAGDLSMRDYMKAVGANCLSLLSVRLPPTSNYWEPLQGFLHVISEGPI